MAHEVESMIFVSEKPWHGLGVELDTPPSIEEALKLARLDWSVSTQPLFAEVSGQRLATDSKAVIRDSDLSVLGVVGKDYTPVQNKDAFGFFNKAIEQKFVDIETAGSLRGGRRVWMLAKIKDTTHDVVTNDPVNAYFMLSNSHDGTLAVRVGFTGVRVVCANTLALAHHDNKSKLIQVRHTKNVNKSLEKLQEIVDWQRSTFRASVEQMRELAKHGCNAETLRKYIEQVFEPEIKVRTTDAEAMRESFDRLEDKIVPLFETGRGNNLQGVAGTLWGAFNAVTEYLTWERGRSNDARLESLWFGQNKKTNERAFEVAMKMAA